MQLSEFRSNASWQAAINLGPGLVRLAEELPASEQLGLAWALQQVMIELPAAIAFDLEDPDRDTRTPVALRLIASLDLIERVYPALDTADTRKEAEALVDRLSQDLKDEAEGRLAHKPGAMQSESKTAPAEPHRVSIPVVPERSGPPSVIIAQAPASAEMPPDQDDHVHADSGE